MPIVKNAPPSPLPSPTGMVLSMLSNTVRLTYNTPGTDCITAIASLAKTGWPSARDMKPNSASSALRMAGATSSHR